MGFSTLDPLREKRAELSRAIEAAKTRQREVQSEVAKLYAELGRVAALIASGAREELSVSEHALLRYAERALGLDTREIGALIEAQIGQQVALLGDGNYPLTGYNETALVAVVKNQTVITVKPA